ncbi:MAG: acylphosphatase [Candidatus Sumerlaeaceae bacterium]|nr:acylphosphatase [Candidatus Sumerlaeaceae bacterium]
MTGKKQPPTLSLYATVSGRVQGVGFRYWVIQEALSLGLRGWVRNLSDGRVDLEAVGDEAALKELERRLWIGPPVARVDEVTVEYQPATKAYSGFHVAY